MSIATQVLVFAATAMGLNIVVGLAGLLDLGYVAFLGVGAYTAALVSGSPYSPSACSSPSGPSALTGAAVAGLRRPHRRPDPAAARRLPRHRHPRLRRDLPHRRQQPRRHLGPRHHQRPQRHLEHPRPGDLRLQLRRGAHVVGHQPGPVRQLLPADAGHHRFVVLVFTRAADSRIGRSWVAIREDETAATAMGINGFRVKLIAFALGACLAGLAGTVSAHVTYTRGQPDQFIARSRRTPPSCSPRSSSAAWAPSAARSSAPPCST